MGQSVSSRLTASGYMIMWHQQDPLIFFNGSFAAVIDVKDADGKQSDTSAYLAWDMPRTVTQTINTIVEGCTK